MTGHEFAAFPEAISQDRIVEIGCGFFTRTDGEPAGHVAMAQTGDLREDEPHPVALLPACAQFALHRFEYRLLGIHETLQIVRVAHFLLRA